MFKKSWKDVYEEFVAASQSYADRGHYEQAIEAVENAIKVVSRDSSVANTYITEAACGIYVGYKQYTFGGYAYIAVKMAKSGLGHDRILPLMNLAGQYADACDLDIASANYPMYQAWDLIARYFEQNEEHPQWIANAKKEAKIWEGRQMGPNFRTGN